MIADDDVPTLRSLYLPFCPNIVIDNFLIPRPKYMEPTETEFYAVVFDLQLTNLKELYTTHEHIYTKVSKDYYGTLIATITNRGGDIVQFLPDDAMTVCFKNNNNHTTIKSNKELLTRQAVGCAFALKDQLDQFTVHLPDNKKTTIEFKIAISSGHVSGMFVGGLDRRWEHLLSGPPIRQLSPLCDVVKGGEILLTIDAWLPIASQVGIEPIIDETFKSIFEISPKSDHNAADTGDIEATNVVPATALQNNKGWCWPFSIKTNIDLMYNSSTKNKTYSSWSSLPPFTMCVKVLTFIDPDSDPDSTTKSSTNTLPIIGRTKIQAVTANQHSTLEMFLARPISEQLNALFPAVQRGLHDDALSFIENNFQEKRNVSVVQIQLQCFHSSAFGMSTIEINTTQIAFATIQGIIYQHRGAIHQFYETKKGGLTCTAVFGVSTSVRKDDPTRAVLSAIEIYQCLQHVHITASIGVASGEISCGLIGTLDTRCGFCLIGNAMHMSLTLMNNSSRPVFVCETTFEASNYFVEYVLYENENAETKTYAPVVLEAPVEDEEEKEEEQMKTTTNTTPTTMQSTTESITEPAIESSTEPVIEPSTEPVIEPTDTSILAAPLPQIPNESKNKPSAQVNIDTKHAHIGSNLNKATKSHLVQIRSMRLQRVQQLTTLIGRETEMKCFSNLFSGRGHRGLQTIIVEGTVGVGKRTLIHSVGQNLKLDDGIVLWGDTIKSPTLSHQIDLVPFRKILVELLDLDAFVEDVMGLEHMSPAKVIDVYNNFVKAEIIKIHPSLVIGLPLLNYLLPTAYGMECALLNGKSSQFVMDLRIEYLKLVLLLGISKRKVNTMLVMDNIDAMDRASWLLLTTMLEWRDTQIISEWGVARKLGYAEKKEEKKEERKEAEKREQMNSFSSWSTTEQPSHHFTPIPMTSLHREKLVESLKKVPGLAVLSIETIQTLVQDTEIALYSINKGCTFLEQGKSSFRSLMVLHAGQVDLSMHKPNPLAAKNTSTDASSTSVLSPRLSLAPVKEEVVEEEGEESKHLDAKPAQEVFRSLKRGEHFAQDTLRLSSYPYSATANCTCVVFVLKANILVKYINAKNGCKHPTMLFDMTRILKRSMSDIITIGGGQVQTLIEKARELESSLNKCYNIPLFVVLIKQSTTETKSTYSYQPKQNINHSYRYIQSLQVEHHLILSPFSINETSKQIISMITKLNIYGTVKSITQEALNYLFNQTKGNPLHTKSLTLLLLDGGTFVIVEKTCRLKWKVENIPNEEKETAIDTMIDDAIDSTIDMDNAVLSLMQLLSEEELEVLSFLSVAGPHFDVSFITYLCDHEMNRFQYNKSSNHDTPASGLCQKKSGNKLVMLEKREADNAIVEQGNDDIEEEDEEMPNKATMQLLARFKMGSSSVDSTSTNTTNIALILNNLITKHRIIQYSTALSCYQFQNQFDLLLVYTRLLSMKKRRRLHTLVGDYLHCSEAKSYWSIGTHYRKGITTTMVQQKAIYYLTKAIEVGDNDEKAISMCKDVLTLLQTIRTCEGNVGSNNKFIGALLLPPCATTANYNNGNDDVMVASEIDANEKNCNNMYNTLLSLVTMQSCMHRTLGMIFFEQMNSEKMTHYMSSAVVLWENHLDNMTAMRIVHANMNTNANTRVNTFNNTAIHEQHCKFQVEQKELSNISLFVAMVAMIHGGAEESLDVLKDYYLIDNKKVPEIEETEEIEEIEGIEGIEGKEGEDGKGKVQREQRVETKEAKEKEENQRLQQNNDEYETEEEETKSTNDKEAVDIEFEIMRAYFLTHSRRKPLSLLGQSIEKLKTMFAMFHCFGNKGETTVEDVDGSDEDDSENIERLAELENKEDVAIHQLLIEIRSEVVDVNYGEQSKLGILFYLSTLFELARGLAGAKVIEVFGRQAALHFESCTRYFYQMHMHALRLVVLSQTLYGNAADAQFNLVHMNLTLSSSTPHHHQLRLMLLVDQLYVRFPSGDDDPLDAKKHVADCLHLLRVVEDFTCSTFDVGAIIYMYSVLSSVAYSYDAWQSRLLAQKAMHAIQKHPKFMAYVTSSMISLPSLPVLPLSTNVLYAMVGLALLFDTYITRHDIQYEKALVMHAENVVEKKKVGKTWQESRKYHDLIDEIDSLRDSIGLLYKSLKYISITVPIAETYAGYIQARIYRSSNQLMPLAPKKRMQQLETWENAIKGSFENVCKYVGLVVLKRFEFERVWVGIQLLLVQTVKSKEKEDEQMEGLIEKVKALEDVVKDITQMGDVAYALALKKVVVGIAVNHKKEGYLGKKKQGKKREKGMRGIRDIRDWNLAHSTF